MSGFTYQGGDLDRVYMTTSGLFDSFVGERLYTWGYNAQGQLGTGTTTNSSSPGTVAGGGTTWSSVACSYHHVGAVKTDGTLWTWGRNNSGQLGTGSTIVGTSGQSSPNTVVGGGTTWSQVTCGYNFIAAVKTNGTLWSWGANDRSQLGTGSTTNTSSPVQEASLGTNWRQLSAGAGYHTAAIKTDGTLWTWGYNNFGQLGNSSTTNTSSPGTVAGGGTTWRQVSAGRYYTTAIKTDGTLWTWGYNTYGQLGNGTTTNTSSPNTVASGGTAWRVVSTVNNVTTAIKTDGTLWTWGYNTYGQLGNGTTTNRSSPGTVASGGTAWKQVACGYSYVGAIKTDGTLWTWGRGNDGQLGNGSTANTSSPLQVAAGISTTWKQVACGYATIAIG